MEDSHLKNSVHSRQSCNIFGNENVQYIEASSNILLREINGNANLVVIAQHWKSEMH